MSGMIRLGGTGVAVLDRLDMRLRLAFCLAGVIVALVLERPAALAVLLVAALGLALACGRGLRAILHRLVHVEAFMLVLIAGLALTAPGPTVAIGPLALSVEGLTRGLVIALRVGSTVLLVLALVAGAPPVRLAGALRQFGVPDMLVQLFLTSLRQIDLIGAEALRLREAMAVRGFRPATSRHTLATLGLFAGQMLVRALARAERMEEAMRLRGFTGRFIAPDPERLGPADGIAAAGAGVALGALLIWDRLA